MRNSKRIAGLLGPTLAALTLSEAINLDIWANNIAPITFLSGTLLFVAGLSIVRVHNYWTGDWPVLVTLVGWGAIVGGLFRMFAPKVQQGGPNVPMFAFLALGFVTGSFLTFKAYSRAKPKVE